MTWPTRACGRPAVRPSGGSWPDASPLAPRIRSRVAPGWLFSVSAVLGLSVIGLAAAVTGAVVEDVTDGDGTAVLDRPVAAFAARRSGALTVVMREVRAVGGPVVLAAAGVLLAFLRRHWGPAAAAAVTVAGSTALTVVFKQAFGRPRPQLAGAVAAAVFGVLAYLCAAGLRSWAGRVAIWAAAAARLPVSPAGPFGPRRPGPMALGGAAGGAISG